MTELKSREEWIDEHGACTMFFMFGGPVRVNVNFDTRYGYVKSNAWFILTTNVAKLLGQFLGDKQVVEVFAGSGHLAYHLQKEGNMKPGQYRAYDNFTWGKGLRQAHHRYKTVTQKNAFSAPIKKADAVVMTWPAYEANHAYRIARKMVSGQYLVYNGEGRGGCTGDDAFYKYMENHFYVSDEIDTVVEKVNEQHICFMGVNDYWQILRKR